MKIIDIGQVIDNIDPKGIGRIRASRYNEKMGVTENAIPYEKWSKQDPFVCIPFLPTNINFIPEIGQSVKIINYDTTKNTVNKEYIAGPFSTSYDFNSQTWSHQVENTTYGSTTQDSKDVFNQTGEYIKSESDGALAQSSDFGIYGKYGSDVIFTENGIVLRGGKLIAKEGANSSERLDLLSYPLMSDKISKISLKKFPHELYLVPQSVTTTKTESKLLSYIVEYQIDNLTNPTLISYYVYKINKNSATSDYETNQFNQYTPIDLSMMTLLNTDNTTGFTATPTFSSNVVTPNGLDPITQTYIDIRDTLYILATNGIKNTIENLRLSGVLHIDDTKFSQYPSDDTHPLYFRPSNIFLNLTPTSTGNTVNKLNILNNVNVFGSGPQFGLLYSSTSVVPPVTTQTKTQNLPVSNPNSNEQTFAAVTSDKIYFLSTNTNETNLNVNFDNLDTYEYTQDDYIQNIDPNTYSTVRGENLVLLIRSMIKVLFNHQHNLTKPMVKVGYNEYDQLVNLLSTIENDILNKSIRIN